MNEYNVTLRDENWHDIEMTCRAEDFNGAEQEALKVYDDGICTVTSISIVTRNSSVIINEDVIVEYNKRMTRNGKIYGLWDVNVWCSVGHGNWVSYNCFLTKEEAVAWAKIEENVQ